MSFRVLPLVLSVLLAGCVHLPLAEDFLGQSRGVPVLVDGHGKPLSKDETGRILDDVAGSSAEGLRLRRLVSEMEAISGTPFVSGNKVTLLIDPKDSFAAMLRLVQEAKETINIETFILKSDRI